MSLPTPVVLSDYQQQTQRLLNDPTQAEYNLVDITTYINIARGQIAASTQCIRYTGAFTTLAATQNYALSSISVPAGVAGALNVRMLSLDVSTGQRFLDERSWEWFFTYYICVPSPASGPPIHWAVQEQGPLGAISLYPIPNQAYIINADAVGYPINLTGDLDPEAIPYSWTDAVPYFAAYLAYLNTQREADAQQMLARWSQFSTFATRQTTPTVLPGYAPGGAGAAGAAVKLLNTGAGAPAQPARGGGMNG